MRAPAAAAFALLAWSGIAGAGEIVIEVPGAEVSGETVSYDCAAAALQVRYVNAGDVSLAVFEADGETVVAVAVVAASGVRYAGGRHVWWTKGDEASLYDAMRGEGAEPILECRAAS